MRSFGMRGARPAICWLVVVSACVPCHGQSLRQLFGRALSGSSQDDASQWSIISLDEFTNRVRRSNDAAVAKAREVHRMLSRVQDQVSLDAAIQHFEDMLEELEEVELTRDQLMVEVGSDEQARLKAALQQAAGAARETVPTLLQQIRRESERIGQLPSVSQTSLMELEDVMTRVGQALSQTDHELAAAMRVYPPDESITIHISGELDHQDALTLMEYVRDRTPPDNVRIRSRGTGYQLVAAPHDTADDLAALLTIGQVSGIRESEFHWRVNREEFADFAEEREEAKRAKREQEEKERLARRQMHANRRSLQIKSDLVEIRDGLRAITTVARCRAMFEGVCYKSIRVKAHFEQDAIFDDAELSDGPLHTRPEYEEIAAEIERLAQSSDMKLVMEEYLSSVTVEGFWAYDPWTRHKHLRPAEDPSHPSYVAANAGLLETGTIFEQQDALERFLSIDPKSVDRETRVRVAKAIRAAALSGKPFLARKVVDPLVHWVGKYADKVLIPMLDQAHVGERTRIINELAQMPSEEAAEAIARQLDGPFPDAAALSALRQMGSFAEKAAIRLVRSNHSQVCLTAIEILSEHGSGASVAILRQASAKSPSLAVREAAKAALREVRKRSARERSEARAS